MSGTGTCQVLKLQKAPKLLQMWQAYQNPFWHDELKGKVDEEWEGYQVKMAEERKPKKSYFAFTSSKMQEWFEATLPEVKARVEQHRLDMKMKLLEGNAAALAYQR